MVRFVNEKIVEMLPLGPFQPFLTGEGLDGSHLYVSFGSGLQGTLDDAAMYVESVFQYVLYLRQQFRPMRHDEELRAAVVADGVSVQIVYDGSEHDRFSGACRHLVKEVRMMSPGLEYPFLRVYLVISQTVVVLPHPGKHLFG